MIGRTLDRRALGKRVGERDAQLDDVRSAFDERRDEGERRFDVGIANGDECDEAGAAFGLHTGEGGLYAAGWAKIGGRAHECCATPALKATRLKRKCAMKLARSDPVKEYPQAKIAPIAATGGIR